MNEQLRILVADDHGLMRRGVRGLLDEQRGWTVVAEAANGREAVEQAKRLKPDVAVLDVTMPELDGLEATRQLREATPNTKVLILTMHESKQMVRRLFEAGASGYVLKSDFPRSLVEAVRNVSRDKRFLSSKAAEIVLNGFLEAPDAPLESPPTKLSERKPTQRERQIIRLLGAGKSHKEIAAELGMAVRTVETHRAKIMLKLGLNTLPQLIQYAMRNGLTIPEGACDPDTERSQESLRGTK
jgi:DNA-binding NarL/FixJ family response regulator